MSKWSDTLLSEKSTRRGLDKQKAMEILWEFYGFWDSMSEIREDYRRCKKFVKGDQWSDLTKFDGMNMTEEEAMERQGRNAIVNNFLKILLRNYKGAYIKQDMEPTCKARKSELQPMADALSTALQYLWDINSQKELNADIFYEGLQSAAFVGKVSIGMAKGVYDVWSEVVDLNKFVIDTNASDPRGLDIEMIGQIHDMTKSRIINTFASQPGDVQRIADLLGGCDQKANFRWAKRKFGNGDTDKDIFWQTSEQGLYRVYEIWKKEYRDGYICHDYAKGELYKISAKEKADIDEENEIRLQAAMKAGIPPSVINQARKELKDTKNQPINAAGLKLITTQYFYEDYWYFRYLLADGSVIREGESPYAHHEHPYVFRLYPMTGGVVRSFISDVIDLQKDMNKMDSLYEWIIRHAAKGALLLPRDQMDVEHGWNLHKYGQMWSRPDAVIPFKPKPGATVPQQIASNNTNIGITERIAQKQQWIQDISGIQGTLQGKQMYSGMSGSLYAQQTQNASTSLMDMLFKFSGWTCELSKKQILCMQQVYDEERFKDICGSYGKRFTDLKQIYKTEVYVSVSESASSPVYRAVVNDELKWMVQMGMIDINTYLNNCTMPYGWKLQNDIAMAAQQAMQQGQQPLPTSVPQGMPGAGGGMSGGSGNPYTQASGDNMYNRQVAGSKQAMMGS